MIEHIPKAAERLARSIAARLALELFVARSAFKRNNWKAQRISIDHLLTRLALTANLLTFVAISQVIGIAVPGRRVERCDPGRLGRGRRD
jgi:hypothetical protein